MLRRQLEIINEIVGASQEISGNQLAKTFSVSLRTIRYDIKLIEEKISDAGAHIHSNKKGYYIFPDQKKAVITFLLEEAQNYIPQTKNERSIALLINLIFNPLSIYEASDLLLLSESSTEMTLKEIKALLDQRFPNVTLKKNQNGEFYLCGHDFAKCNLLSSLLSHNSNYDVFANYLRYAQLKNDLIAEHKEVCKYFLHFFKENEITLSGNGLYSLAMDFVSLKLLTMNTLNGIYLPEANVSAKNIFTLISTETSKLIHYGYSECELKYLYVCFLSKSYSSQNSISFFARTNLPQLVNNFISRIKSSYDELELLDDVALEKKLLTYLYPCIVRLKNHFYLENPLKNDLLKTIPYYFQLLHPLFKSLLDEFEVSLTQVELSYLALIIYNATLPLLKKEDRILILSDFGEEVLAMITNKISHTLSIEPSQIFTMSLPEFRFTRLPADIRLVISTSQIEKQLLSKLDITCIFISPKLNTEETTSVLNVWNNIKDSNVLSIQSEHQDAVNVDLTTHRSEFQNIIYQTHSDYLICNPVQSRKNKVIVMNSKKFNKTYILPEIINSLDASNNVYLLVDNILRNK